MNRFLSVGDGLVTTKGKKIIFSTNLENLDSVDSALIRPGRCFDVLQFGKLKTEQANKLCNKLGLEPVNKDTTVAEIFHTQTHKMKEKKFGFI